jgi:two-component system, LytTR family, sensor kinase
MIYIHLLESMSLIAVAAYVYSQVNIFKKLIKNELENSDKLMLIVFFGLLGILSNYTGVDVRPYNINNNNNNIGFYDAIANTRPIAAVVAGYIGGSFLGIGVGAISGLHRYFLGGFTALPCALATIFEGIIGALTRKYSNDSDFNVKHIFIGTVVAEIIQMGIILLISRPFSIAYKLVNIIALPMILINSFGAAIFVNIIKNERESYNIIGAIQAQKVLNIAQKTVNYMRKGLNVETAKKVSKIIYEMSDIEGVFIGDKHRILAYSGKELNKDEVDKKLSDYYDNPGYRIIEISHKRKKLVFIFIPFNISNSDFEGMLGFGIKSKKQLNIYFKQFIEELCSLLSNQIELYKLNKMAEELSTAKFQVLRAQIKPHFLFNTLNTIASLCRTNPLKARGLIVDLSNYFRQTLKNQEDFLPLKYEIEFIKSYISIEKARFGNRLKLVIDIPKSLMNINMPVFILQPIVENAVNHGILPKAEGGTIFLKVDLYRNYEKSRDELIFSVEDNGVGMDKKILKNLINNCTSMGLKNVNERLKLLYGENYKINIETLPNKGTKVSFSIPIEEGGLYSK